MKFYISFSYIHTIRCQNECDVLIKSIIYNAFCAQPRKTVGNYPLWMCIQSFALNFAYIFIMSNKLTSFQWKICKTSGNCTATEVAHI